MELHTREWGTGDRVAVLIHGIMADSRAWWRVGPALATLGYRVIAVDLPGHGQSARAPEYSPELFANSVLATVPHSPELAMGHSLGGLVLAVAVERLRPERAVYSDPVLRVPAWGIDAEALAEGKHLTREAIAQAHPGWGDDDVELEVEMLRLWDPATVESLDRIVGLDYVPDPYVVPSLIQVADPSTLVPPALADELRVRGFDVRVVPGAEHTIHRHLFDEFLVSLQGWV